MNEMAQRLLLAAASGADEPDDEIAATVLDAALRQFELFGIGKSSVDDVAKRAKVARVTVYRRFANKGALVDAVFVRELRRFQTELLAAVNEYAEPEDQLIEGFAFTVRTVRSHKLLQRLLESERDEMLPHFIADDGTFLDLGRTFLAARMATELDDGRTFEELLVAADVVSRLVISYVITPGPVVDFDDPDTARQFARTYLLRILQADDPA